MVSRLLHLNGSLVDALANWKPGFRQVPVGGGGYVTGLHVAGDTMYARTDVGGAYRYDNTHQRWTQLVTSKSITTGRTIHDYKVEGIGAAPSSPNVVYMAVGGGAGGRVLASTDRGKTWPVSSPATFYIGGNEANRFGGQRIAVDPDNPQVAYFGTRKDGLHYTVNGGASWTKLTNLPATVGDSATTGALGTPSVVIDRASPFTGGRHQHLWASVYGVGLVKSTDGGASWTTVSAWNPTGGWVSSMVQDSNGDLIATFYAATTAKVRRITQAGTVTDIDPAASAWQFVAVDSTDPTKLFISNRTMNTNSNTRRSTDGGTTWQAVTNMSWGGTDTPWLSNVVMPAAAPWNLGQAVYHQGDLYIAEGHGVWKATAVAGNHITWVSVISGIEELVANTTLKTTGNPLLLTAWDYALFSKPDASAASLPFQTSFTSGWDVAASPTDPDFIVAILDDHQDAADRGSGYSTDGGTTWTKFPYLTGTPAADLRFGNIAVSASNNDNIVWIPAGLTGTGSKIYYSTNRGTTFTAATLTGLGASDTIYHANYFMARHILVADPATPGTFYALGSGAASAPVLWKSTNNGATWAKVTTTGLAGSFAGDSTLIHDGTALWAVPGNGGTGIYRSTDGGVTWTQKATIIDAIQLGVGAPMPGSSAHTLFTFGTVGGVSGFYLSRDNAATWELLADYPFGIYTGIRHIAGDPEVAAKVYVALGGGTGFAVGQF